MGNPEQESQAANDPFSLTGLTYDDVLLLPGDTDVIPSEASTASRLTKEIELNIPLVSAAMDTVTESRMAIAMARIGGLGIIHRNLSAEDQANQVDYVKRSESGMINDPLTITPDKTLEELDEICGKCRISGLPVVDENNVLVGIVTNRDLRFVTRSEFPTRTVAETMTKMPLVTAPVGVAAEKAFELLAEHKVEKLPLVDDNNVIQGLITVKDFVKTEEYPLATKDDEGRLRVGAAVGFYGDAYERAGMLAEAGADVLVVDTAHGHQVKMLDTLSAIADAELGVPIVAGNVVTAEGVRDLVSAGADIVKVGVGPGAMCTTRMMTAVGRPQFSAVLECAEAARELGAHVWADGGVRYPRDVALALAAGASQVMVGSWFAGTHESPGDLLIDGEGRKYKESFGMASARAVANRTRTESAFARARKGLFEEGISSSTMYIDPESPGVEDLLDGITSGVRSSCTYAGAGSLGEFARLAAVGVQSAAGYEEGRPLSGSW